MTLDLDLLLEKEMAARQINPGSAFDPWLAVPFLLALSKPLAQMVSALEPAHPGAAPVEPNPADNTLRVILLGPSSVSDFAGCIGVAVALLAIVAFFLLRPRAERTRSGQALMAAFMAPAGALVVFFLALLLGTGLTGLADALLPEWVVNSPVGWLSVLVPVGMVFAAGYWSGWRAGSWGAVWGAGAALFCVAVTFAPAVGGAGAGLKAWHVGSALWAMVVGAFAGMRGAARFQRDAAGEAVATAGRVQHAA